MTRTIKAIKATAITLTEDGNTATTTATIIVENFNDKTVDKARKKYEDRHDVKVIKSTAKKVQITTSMPDEMYLKLCTYGEEVEVTDTDTDTATA